jgi:hypothetical protein
MFIGKTGKRVQFNKPRFPKPAFVIASWIGHPASGRQDIKIEGQTSAHNSACFIVRSVEVVNKNTTSEGKTLVCGRQQKADLLFLENLQHMAEKYGIRSVGKRIAKEISTDGIDPVTLRTGLILCNACYAR